LLRFSSAILSRIARVCFPIILAAGTCHAQSISGIVYDPTGGVVSGARVMLMQDYVKVQETKSAPSGEFSFTALKPGMYQLQIKQRMFSLFQITVMLEGNEQARVYAVLPLARVFEEVQTNAQLPAGTQKGAAAEPASRAGGRVEPAKALEPPRPAYPPGAAARGLEGSVALFATIKTDGSVSDVVVLKSPDQALAEEAIPAVKKSRYQPMKLNGRPVETQMTIVFNFRLQYGVAWSCS
jgi:TonB family protein